MSTLLHQIHPSLSSIYQHAVHIFREFNLGSSADLYMSMHTWQLCFFSCCMFKLVMCGQQPSSFSHDLQVFPGAWTAILVYLDNDGIWNLRTENLDSWYLGQEVYVSVVNPETDKSEPSVPDNSIYCGLLSSLQR